MTPAEHRSAALEVRGRTISGLAVPWGARARVRIPSGEVMQETFIREAFPELGPVPLLLEHGGSRIGELKPSNTDRGLEVVGEYTGQLNGRERFSIEFRARSETKSEGLRIVTSAVLEGVAAVRAPAYSGARIEQRQEGEFSSSIRIDQTIDCTCAGQGAGTGVLTIRFTDTAFQRVVDDVQEGRHAVSAIARGADAVVATTDNGSLHLSVARGGSLGVAFDPLDTAAGRNVREAVAAGVLVYARPVIDFDASDFTVDGATAVVSRAQFDYVLIKPTARRGGLEPLAVGEPPEPEPRALSAARRRALLLGAA